MSSCLVAACERPLAAPATNNKPAVSQPSASVPSPKPDGETVVSDGDGNAVPTDEELSGSPESAGGESAGGEDAHQEGSSLVTESGESLPEPLYLAPIADPVNQGRALSDRFANLQPWECRAELRKRRISVGPAGMPARGVALPLRLDGPMGSVRYITPGRKSQHGILDCRLILLLEAIVPRLSALSVKHVHVGGFYRPNSRLPGKKYPSQHAHGLAADIVAFGMEDGTLLDVEQDFHGILGEPVCGPNAGFSDRTPKAVLLRNIVCDLGRVGAFNYFLTPNYDAPHRNHLHADIKRGTRDHVVR